MSPFQGEPLSKALVGFPLGGWRVVLARSRFPALCRTRASNANPNHQSNPTKGYLNTVVKGLDNVNVSGWNSADFFIKSWEALDEKVPCPSSSFLRLDPQTGFGFPLWFPLKPPEKRLPPKKTDHARGNLIVSEVLLLWGSDGKIPLPQTQMLFHPRAQGAQGAQGPRTACGTT